MRVELLTAARKTAAAESMLDAMKRAVRASGATVMETTTFQGGADVLLLWGIGHPEHNAGRNKQLAAGGRVVHLDLGYCGHDRRSISRLSIDRDHPQHLFDETPSDSVRWDELQIPLREDADPNGPIILVGLGRKSRAYLGLPRWEAEKLASLQSRFPGRRIVFRPKGPDVLGLQAPCDSVSPISRLLRGASLVVCRHSNVAVDAAIAGVPFECEEGAGMWLAAREYTRDNRLDFLKRIAHWQYRAEEAGQAWEFAKRMMRCA